MDIIVLSFMEFITRFARCQLQVQVSPDEWAEPGLWANFQ